MSNSEQQQFVSVGEGPVTPYIAKPQQTPHSRESANPVSGQNWPLVKLGDVASLITKGTTPTTHGFEYLSRGVAFIRVEHIKDGAVVRDSVESFISEDAHNFLKRSQLKAGDVLFSIAGTIGRAAVVRGHDLPANTNQAVAIVRGTAERFDARYLCHALSSGSIQRGARAKARGGAMQNISLGDVREFLIPLPPLREQHRIVAELETQLTRLDASVIALLLAPTDWALGEVGRLPITRRNRFSPDS